VFACEQSPFFIVEILRFPRGQCVSPRYDGKTGDTMTSPIFCPQKIKKINFWTTWRQFGGMDGAPVSTVNPGKLAEQVFGEKMEAAQLFFYLYRRFGPPIDADDDYKIAATYSLTTPRDDTFLRIAIHGSDRTSIHFGFAVTHEIGDRLRTEDDEYHKAWHAAKAAWFAANGIVIPDVSFGTYWSKEGDQIREDHQKALDAYCAAHPGKREELYDPPAPLKTEVNEALLVTIRDLQRPVNIRDIYFNPLGRIADQDFDKADEDGEDWEATYKGLPVAKFFTASSGEEKGEE
jgi:hypothetical protein